MLQPRRTAAVLLVLAPLVLCSTLSAGRASAATGGWTITRTPSSVTEGVATGVSLTATNTSGGSSIGCIRLQIPGAFSVSAVAVDSAPHDWTADPPTGGPSGSTLVWVHAVTEADIVKADGDSVIFHVRVTGTPVGDYAWPAESRDHANCTSGIDTASVTVAVIAGTPTPTSTPKPQPTPTPTPRPTRTPLPTPAPTPAPTPTARPTRTPSPTHSPTPTPDHTARPSGTATPSPAPAVVAPATTSPSPEASSTSTPSERSRPRPVGGSLAGPTSGTDGQTKWTGPDRFGVGLGAESMVIDQSLVTSSLAALGGTLVWAVPSLALTIPGLLLILAIVAQVVGAAAWMPVVRRSLGDFGLGRSVPEPRSGHRGSWRPSSPESADPNG